MVEQMTKDFILFSEVLMQSVLPRRHIYLSLCLGRLPSDIGNTLPYTDTSSLHDLLRALFHWSCLVAKHACLYRRYPVVRTTTMTSAASFPLRAHIIVPHTCITAPAHAPTGTMSATTTSATIRPLIQQRTASCDLQGNRRPRSTHLLMIGCHGRWPHLPLFGPSLASLTSNTLKLSCLAASRLALRITHIWS